VGAAHVTVALLSCWESQAEGVDESAERGEGGLEGLDRREWDQMQPGQQQTRADGGVEEQPQGVELVLPARPGVPGRMGLQGVGGVGGVGAADGAAGGGVLTGPRATLARLCRLTSV
jgi:hypothetical protein